MTQKVQMLTTSAGVCMYIKVFGWYWPKSRLFVFCLLTWSCKSLLLEKDCCSGKYWWVCLSFSKSEYQWIVVSVHTHTRLIVALSWHFLLTWTAFPQFNSCCNVIEPKYHQIKAKNAISCYIPDFSLVQNSYLKTWILMLMYNISNLLTNIYFLSILFKCGRPCWLV